VHVEGDVLLVDAAVQTLQCNEEEKVKVREIYRGGLRRRGQRRRKKEEHRKEGHRRAE
jgi:hypothetical protein